MAESSIAPFGAPTESKGSPVGVLVAALLIFALVMGGFGGLSYGFYYFGATWPGLGFFVGLIVLFIFLLRALRSFFTKCVGRLMFGFGLIAVLGAYFFYLFANNKYPMGIDLAGGTELIYRLDYSQTDRNMAAVQQQLSLEKAKDPNSKRYRDLVNQHSTLDTAKKTAPDKAAEVVRRRVDPTGTKGIPVTTLGSDKERLRIQLPRATEEEVKRIKTAIETQGRLSFHIVTEDRDLITKTSDPKNLTRTYTDPATKEEYEEKIIKKPKQFSEKEEFSEEKVVIKRVPGMTGDKVTLAMARRSSETAGWEIGVRFSAPGEADFFNLTQANVGKRMAIMLDGVVYSAPTIQEAIHGECRISGRFDQEEAEKLAGVLTAGSLPAEVKYENEFTVGPTLGSEQIASGMRATVIGTAAVIVFMLVYYRMSGAIASLCTMLTVLMLLGAMGFFKATLTLPGIAGIVLTLGMSVDANVLILERMREEMARGRPMRLAVSHGFDRAFLTIIDCQLTTIISGVILYYLGTGPVRGFAVSLTLGMLITLFCNLWLNWVITEWLVGKEAFAKLNMMQFFKTTNIDFMGQRRFWITTTVSLAALSLVGFAYLSYQDRLYDVDFKGGTLVQFNFAPGKPQAFEKVKARVEGEAVGDVTKGVKDRAQKVLAGLKAQVAKSQPEAEPANRGEASAALLERRIADIEKSMRTFSLALQPFGTPEKKGEYKSFTITTSATDPGIIEQLEEQLKDTFPTELEPPAISRTGETLRIRFNVKEGLTPAAAKDHVEKAVIEAARDPLYVEIQKPLQDLLGNMDTATEGNYLVVTMSGLPADQKIAAQIERAMGTVKVEGRTSGAISRKSSFGSQVASQMWTSALIALIVANIGVFIYLWFRFEFSGAWGFGAIVALIHDTIVATGGLVAANLLGFPLLIDLNVVAALLTIIGFSVNDTIVVFDRIREVKAAHPTRPYEDIVNEAVNATLSRTILTSLTVLLADASLLIFGGPTIRGLAWTLLVGFIVGTYSSIFIASPLMIWWYRRFGGGQVPMPVSTSRPQKGDMAEGAEV